MDKDPVIPHSGSINQHTAPHPKTHNVSSVSAVQEEERLSTAAHALPTQSAITMIPTTIIRTTIILPSPSPNEIPHQLPATPRHASTRAAAHRFRLVWQFPRRGSPVQ